MARRDAKIIDQRIVEGKRIYADETEHLHRDLNETHVKTKAPRGRVGQRNDNRARRIVDGLIQHGMTGLNEYGWHPSQ